MSINEQYFLSVVRPGLASGNASGLAEAVMAHWRPDETALYLNSANVDVRRAAALVVGLTGDQRMVGPLARALHDDDEQVHQMAEHAMWTIWFRVCDYPSAEPFTRGSELLSEEDYAGAIACLTQMVQQCPQFAEAYNQRAIAHFFAGHFQASAGDCSKALKLMPSHFGAAAGFGHALCHLGDMTGALAAYRKALAINPRMPGIRSAIERIEAKMADSSKPLKTQTRRYTTN